MALFPESDVKEENALRKYDCLLLLLLNIEMYAFSECTPHLRIYRMLQALQPG